MLGLALVSSIGGIPHLHPNLGNRDNKINLSLKPKMRLLLTLFDEANSVSKSQ